MKNHRFLNFSGSVPDISNRYHIRHHTKLLSNITEVDYKSTSIVKSNIHNSTQTESDTPKQAQLLTLSTLKDAINTRTQRHRCKKPTLLRLLSNDDDEENKKRPPIHNFKDSVIEDHLKEHLNQLKQNQTLSLKKPKERLLKDTPLTISEKLVFSKPRLTVEQAVAEKEPQPTPISQFKYPARTPSPIKPSPRKYIKKSRPSILNSVMKQKYFFAQKPVVSQIQLNKKTVSDPIEYEKLEKFKFFFRDLLNNLKILMKSTNLYSKIILRTNGYNHSVRDLLFEYDEDKQQIVSLQLITPIQLYESFIVKESNHVNLRSCSIQDLISVFERSELFRKLQYFSSGISDYLRRRMQEQFTQKIRARKAIVDQIVEKLVARKDEDLNIFPSKYKSAKRFHDVGVCKDFINSFDLLKCELMDSYEHS